MVKELLVTEIKEFTFIVMNNRDILHVSQLKLAKFVHSTKFSESPRAQKFL